MCDERKCSECGTAEYKGATMTNMSVVHKYFETKDLCMVCYPKKKIEYDNREKLPRNIGSGRSVKYKSFEELPEKLRCNKCTEEKELKFFYIQKLVTPKGKVSVRVKKWCKECHRKIMKKWKDSLTPEEKEHIKKYQHDYHQEYKKIKGPMFATTKNLIDYNVIEISSDEFSVGDILSLSKHKPIDSPYVTKVIKPAVYEMSHSVSLLYGEPGKNIYRVGTKNLSDQK